MPTTPTIALKDVLNVDANRNRGVKLKLIRHFNAHIILVSGGYHVTLWKMVRFSLKRDMGQYNEKQVVSPFIVI